MEPGISLLKPRNKSLLLIYQDSRGWKFHPRFFFAPNSDFQISARKSERLKENEMILFCLNQETRRKGFSGNERKARRKHFDDW